MIEAVDANLINGFNKFQGELKLEIPDSPEKWPSVMPSGIYKTEYNVRPDSRDYFYFSYNTEIKSEIRTSF